jgi:tetratricopeptide (TPR) repeat protein
MSIQLTSRRVVTGIMTVLLLAIAVPALAQAIKGRVVNAQRRGVSEAEIVATCVSNPKLEPKGATSDTDGRFQVSGLTFGKWEVVITKGNQFYKTKEPLSLLPGVVNDIGDVALVAMPAGTAPVARNKAEADERNKKAAELQTKFKAANEDINAGKFDDALVKLEAVAKDLPKCSACSAKIGEVYLKKDDLANAEKYFKEAIEFDDKTLDAYKALATIYNTQQKFEDALKMSAKVTELTAASGGTQDPVAVFNEGVVLWNAGKTAEAEAMFKKATELDPKNAAAFYQLGMAQLSGGKNADAVKSFGEYLKLDPKGKDAETAKAILLQIKK